MRLDRRKEGIEEQPENLKRIPFIFTMAGLAVGLFLVLMAYVIQYVAGPPIANANGSFWDTLKSLHAANPILFLMDNTPWVLATVAAVMGKRQKEKAIYLWKLKGMLRRRSAELRSIRSRYTKLFEGVNECLFITTHEGEIIDINQAGITLFKMEELVGEKGKNKGAIREILREKGVSAKTFYASEEDGARLIEELEKKGIVSNYQIRMKRFNGEIFEALFTMSVKTDDGGGKLFFGRIIDLSSVKRAELLLAKANLELERKNRELMEAFSELQVLKVRYEKRSIELERANRELHRLNRLLADMAITDGLTGLYNHRHFRGLLKREWERANREKTNFCVMMIDIDYFKAFNDTWGHQFGDEILKTVAYTIKRQMRSYDVVARYGGEEFCVILPGTDLETCYTIAQRIREAVEDKILLSGPEEKKVKLTVSIGVTIFLPQEGDRRTSDQILQDADVALYRAKSKGRNRVEMHRRDLSAERGYLSFSLRGSNGG